MAPCKPDEEVDKEGSILIDLHHVKQAYDWDCGISSVAMILTDEQRVELFDNLNVIAEEEEFKTSTWTIDLAFLLKRFGVEHLYCTVTIGINPNYKKEVYYKRALVKDTKRVERKFEEATASGVTVEERRVVLSDILDHLSQGNPAIVLVDASLLYCDTCHANQRLSKIARWCRFPLCYQGHYVVVCGYDLKKKKIMYRNPSHSDRVCSIPFDSFERTRKRLGTDEDIVFIYR